MGLFVSMDSMMGKDFESGLTNLRQVAEAAPAPEPAATSPAAAEKASTKAAPSKP
jgi:ribosomal protein L12E/L44/L45/RPP1/RPP2